MIIVKTTFSHKRTKSRVKAYQKEPPVDYYKNDNKNMGISIITLNNWRNVPKSQNQ